MNNKIVSMVELRIISDDKSTFHIVKMMPKEFAKQLMCSIVDWKNIQLMTPASYNQYVVDEEKFYMKLDAIEKIPNLNKIQELENKIIELKKQLSYYSDQNQNQ